VTTETDFGVSTPVITAGGGGIGVLAADPPPLHADIEPAASKVKSAHVRVFFMNPVSRSKPLEQAPSNLPWGIGRPPVIDADSCY